ncbi:MAG: hypothetical protein WBF53_15065 [Litorimonas sp.]
MSKTSNGGGYGNVGDTAPSSQRAEAQAMSGGTESPSSHMNRDFDADGSVAQMAGLANGDSDPRPTAHNAQSQIAYDAEEE